MHADVEAVVAFWFGDGESDDAEAIAEAQSALWWSKSPTLDAEIRTRFGAQREQAISGELEHWAQSPRGRLALIILIDQFSRNLFRDDPRAFAHDALARRWCVDGLARGDDTALRPIERVFFYLPLEHSEQLEDQQRSVQLFENLQNAMPESQQKVFANYADFARRHRDIIARFGRFPHRNAVLGRDSNEAERTFLTQPGSSF